MPFIVPFLPLIAAGVSAAGIGTSVYEGIKSSDEQSANQAFQKDQLAKQQQSAAAQADLTKREAVLGQQGNAQAQTGGSLTDSGTAALTDLLAGYPGYQSGSSGSGTGGGTSGTGAAAVNANTGIGSGIGPNGLPSGAGGLGSGQPPNIAALLATLRSGSGSPGTNLSGGNWQTTPPAPSTYFELANPIV